MTPFDPIALLSMLLAFYPVVSVPELQRALRERPDYFAGGRLVSTSGEKLELPDGRVFDLIFDVSGESGGPRWQVILATPGGPDPFPLEPGPLTPIAIDVVLPPPSSGPSFESIVADALGELAAADGAIGLHERTIAEAADPIGFDVEFEQTIGAAAATLDEDRIVFSGLNPGALIDRSLEQEFGIDGVDRELPDPGDAPPDIDSPDIGDPPREERPPPEREK